MNASLGYLILALVSCTSVYAESPARQVQQNCVSYRESLMFEGKSGSGTRDLRFKKVDWELLGPTSFAVLPDGSVWIPDDLNAHLKHFSVSGEIVDSIRLDSGVSVDDICVDSDGRIIVRLWEDREHLWIFDPVRLVSAESYRLPMTRGARAAVQLFWHTGGLYANYVDSVHNRISMRYPSGATVPECRSFGRCLWAESGGLYNVPDDSAGSPASCFALADVLKEDGSIFYHDTLYLKVECEAIGTDARGNLFVQYQVDSHSGDSSLWRIVRISRFGYVDAVFSIKDWRYSVDTHGIKVDDSGNVYVLWVASAGDRWALYKYSAWKQR